ncbi:integrase_H2C2 domain-containing protein, partial [Nephila pilipes]
MFRATKGFIKEDLLYVAEEIGEILPEKVKISELKDIILKNKAYLEDPEFVTSILVTASMQLRSFQDEKFLAKMQAFKDEEGLLRIRTKLVDSDEKEDFKFPVLLPANDVVVKLIREEHKKAMHA